MTRDALNHAVAAGSGLLIRRDHPRLTSAIDRALRAGLLQTVFPGVYAAPGDIGLALRVRAALHVAPAAVVTGAAAASLTWWPEISVGRVRLACSRKRAAGPHVSWERRIVPPDLVLAEGGLRVTHPALTVLDLVPTLGGDAIDEALRRRAVTLESLWTVFRALPPRRGDALRRWLLEDSRDEPWSRAERELHRLYRALGLPYGYATNHRVDLPDGTYRLLDLAIPDLLLGFEVDGWGYHSSRASFDDDRAADAALATITWQRLRFDADRVLGAGASVSATMAAIVASRETLLRGTRPAGARVRRTKR